MKTNAKKVLRPNQVIIKNGKRIPYWGTDKDLLTKLIKIQNATKMYKTTFGKLRPMKQLDVNEFFPEKLTRGYRR